MAATARPELLHGWAARSPVALSHVFDPQTEADVETLLGLPFPRGTIPRGAGHSLGDAAQRAGGRVIRTSALNGLVAFDDERGTVTVQAGMSLGELMRLVVPRGWLPAALPTTRFVTVGGAIAFDVHGRNQHSDGSFADHVNSIRLLGPRAASTLGPADSPDVFWATAGGMGLTGVVLEATLRLTRIESTQMLVQTQRITDLDDAMVKLTAADGRSRYSAAWIDCLASGRSRGRGVLVSADHATRDQAHNLRGGDSLDFSLGPRVRLPKRLPSLLRGPGARALNEAIYRRAPVRAQQNLQPLGRYFHLHDRVENWFGLTGRRGFVEYQFVVPLERDDLVREAIERLSASSVGPFFAVLKRFGRASSGALSFPMPGWMLALDIPLRPGLAQELNALDGAVAEAGGRIYLAKDARLRPDVVAAMYSGLPRWRSARERIDPDGVLCSDLSERLCLT